MKIFLLFIITLAFSCKTEPAEKQTNSDETKITKALEKSPEPTKEVVTKTTPKKGAASAPEHDVKKSFPEALVKIFDAHGGLENWQAMAALTYTEIKKDSKALTTTNLKTR